MQVNISQNHFSTLLLYICLIHIVCIVDNSFIIHADVLFNEEVNDKVKVNWM